MMLITCLSFGQVYLDEDFTGGMNGWTPMTTNWVHYNSHFAGGEAPEIIFFASPTVIGQTEFVSPVLDLSDAPSLAVNFKYKLRNNSSYPGPDTIGVATRSVEHPEWKPVWEKEVLAVNIAPIEIWAPIDNEDINSSEFELCLFFKGNTSHIKNWYFDDILLYAPLPLDPWLITLDVDNYIGTGTDVDIKGTILNYGLASVSYFEANWQLDDGSIYTTNFTDIDLAFGESYDFTCNDVLNTEASGDHALNVWISNINEAGDDDDIDNNLIELPLIVASQSVAHILLYEVFTASTCAPCVPYTENVLNPLFNNPENEGKFALIKYQMNWPGAGDPYYTEEGGTRRYYYACNSIPNLYLDGIHAYQLFDTQEAFDSLYEKPTFIELNSLHDIDGTTMNVTVEVTPYFNITDFTVHIVVVENMTTGNVGTNGETEFTNVMMKMMPGDSGTLVSALDGETVYITESADLSGTFIEEFDDLSVIVFIQDDETKMVFNAANSLEGYTGIKENAAHLNIYPNPAKGLVNISFNLSSNQNVTTNVYNMLGEVVYNETERSYAAGQNNIKLNTSDLQEGIYFVELLINSKKYLRKVSVIK